MADKKESTKASSNSNAGWWKELSTFGKVALTLIAAVLIIFIINQITDAFSSSDSRSGGWRHRDGGLFTWGDQMKYRTAQEFLATLEILDADQDGALERNDIIDYMLQFDQNSDSEINRDELRQAFAEFFGLVANPAFSILDLDGNDSISVAELEELPDWKHRGRFRNFFSD